MHHGHSGKSISRFRVRFHFRATWLAVLLLPFVLLGCDSPKDESYNPVYPLLHRAGRGS